MLDSDLNMIPTPRHQTVGLSHMLLSSGKIRRRLGWHEYSSTQKGQLVAHSTVVLDDVAAVMGELDVG
jgi:hypothetical protein